MLSGSRSMNFRISDDPLAKNSSSVQSPWSTGHFL